MIFWDLEQRRKWAREREAADREREAAEQAREKAIQEHLAAVRRETRTEVASDLLAAGLVKSEQDLAQWARAKGITLRIPPPY